MRIRDDVAGSFSAPNLVLAGGASTSDLVDLDVETASPLRTRGGAPGDPFGLTDKLATRRSRTPACGVGRVAQPFGFAPTDPSERGGHVPFGDQRPRHVPLHET